LWKVKIDWRSSPAALPRETWTLFGDDLQPVVFTRQPGEIKTSVLPVIKSAP